MEKLLGRREYLKNFLGSYTSLKDGQHLPQRPFKEANNNISTPGLCSTYGQVNNSAPRKAKTRTSNKKTRYKACQVR